MWGYNIMFILAVLFITLILNNRRVICQVCVETQMVWREVPETYTYTYTEAYEKSFCLFWCTDTRVATATGTRNILKQVSENVNVCCEGYIKDENSTVSSILCKPNCSPECTNGYCKAPNECSCDVGYIPDSFDHSLCKPLCINGCAHGSCISPNTCQCDDGYEMYEGKCEPICNEPCINGACIAPDTCHCLPGYQKTEDDICELHCSEYTEYGECVYSDSCQPGWSKVMEEGVEICEPICRNLCVNGVCVSPDKCECYRGYEYETEDKCVPYCSSGCLHGYCASPENCVCNPGWYRKDAEEICLPHCDQVCGNGTCVAPDICECFDGYELNKEKNGHACVPVCRHCEGICVAPNECICEHNLEARNVTADGFDCNCYDDNCDLRNICEKTVCVSKSTTIKAIDEIQFDEEITATINVEQDTEKSNESHYFDGKIEKSSWFHSKWIYGSISVILTGFLILIIVTIMKKRYNSGSKDISFNRDVSGNDTLAVHYKV